MKSICLLLPTLFEQSSTLIGLVFTCGLGKIMWIVLAQNGLTLKSYVSQKFLPRGRAWNYWQKCPRTWSASTECGQKFSTPPGKFVGFLKIVVHEWWMTKRRNRTLNFTFFSDVRYSVLLTMKMWSTEAASMKHHRNEGKLDSINWVLYSLI